MVIVDSMRTPARVGRISGRWSHLTASTPDELHAFAERLGMRRSWYQDKGDGRWHYDVTDSVRERAIELGAVPVAMAHLGVFVRTRRLAGPAAAEAALAVLMPT